jgi:nucleoside-diphosphate-sugar epimerase
MKILFIGGTGRISMAVSRQVIAEGLDLYLLNRGSHNAELSGCHCVIGDIQTPEVVRTALQGLQFDVVVDWIAYTPDEIERDLAIFRGRVKQYIFISSASVYNKPPRHFLVGESTPRHNPYSDYSRNKIACENRLLRAYHEEAFPATIVRPSHTYDRHFPFSIGGSAGYTVADRMKKGKPAIVHGDGSSLWVVTHAEDFARGFLGLIGNEQSVGEAFNITSDEILTWNQIYQTIADALGVELNIVHIPSDFIAHVEPSLAATLFGDKTWSVAFDNSKIKSFVPSFEAIIPFREGILRTVKWFEADEKRRQVDHVLNETIDRILRAYDGIGWSRTDGHV